MLTNIYDPNDNYYLSNSHVMTALIGKAHEAKENNKPTLTVYGTSTARREFIYVDDLVKARVFLMEEG